MIIWHLTDKNMETHGAQHPLQEYFKLLWCLYFKYDTFQIRVLYIIVYLNSPFQYCNKKIVFEILLGGAHPVRPPYKSTLALGTELSPLLLIEINSD